METIELEVLSGYCCVYAVEGPKLTFVFFCLVLHYHYIYKAVIEKHTNVFAYPLVSFLLMWCVQILGIFLHRKSSLFGGKMSIFFAQQ